MIFEKTPTRSSCLICSSGAALYGNFEVSYWERKQTISGTISSIKWQYGGGFTERTFDPPKDAIINSMLVEVVLVDEHAEVEIK